jgi:hypothetical protein
MIEPWWLYKERKGVHIQTYPPGWGAAKGDLRKSLYHAVWTFIPKSISHNKPLFLIYKAAYLRYFILVMKR